MNDQNPIPPSQNPSPPYEAPAIESVLDADDLEREVQYAGLVTGP